MEIFEKKSGKERLYEMFQKVGKVKLNENINDLNILNISFEKLKNNQLNIEQTDTQVDDNISYASIDCLDENKNQIKFNLKAVISETDQDNVFNVEEVNLIKFSFISSKDFNNNVELEENDLTEFNNEHKTELEDIADEYIDVESTINDKLFEEIAKKIDSYPYGGGSNRLQTAKNYVDEKPINPKLRVNNDGLDKFIDEEENVENNYEIQVGDRFTDILYGGFFIVNKIDIPNNKIYMVDADYGTKYTVPYDKMLQLSGDKVDQDNYDFQFLRTNHDKNIDWDQMEQNKEMKRKRVDRINDIIRNKEASYQLTGKYYPTQYDFKDISNQKLGLDENIDVEELTKEKEQVGDIIKGGLGDNDTPSQYDSEQIAKGIKVEMEHTANPLIALDIVLDHLHEKPDYYTLTDNPDDSAQLNAAEDTNKQEVDTEDILLGYKPKNIGEELEFMQQEYGFDDEIKKHLRNLYSNSNFHKAGNVEQRINQLIDLHKKWLEIAKKQYSAKDIAIKLFKYDENLGNIKEEIMNEFGFELNNGEYVGDQYKDKEGNSYYVDDFTIDGVVLKDKNGNKKEVTTSDLKNMGKY